MSVVSSSVLAAGILYLVSYRKAGSYLTKSTRMLLNTRNASLAAVG